MKKPAPGRHGVESVEEDFGTDSLGWAGYWHVEFEAAEQEIQSFHNDAQAATNAYHDQRSDQNKNSYHVNLFWSNMVTQRSLLLGKMPRTTVTRRYEDANDDEARVAGPVIMQRLLDTDIEKGVDGYAIALKKCLIDAQLTGIGFARVRYEAEHHEVEERVDDEGNVLAPGGKVKVSENVCTDYIFWRDMLWSPARSFEDWRWWAYRTTLTKEEVAKRFGDDHANRVPYAAQRHDRLDEEAERPEVWDLCEVWEVWSKEHKKVFWLVKGYDQVLDMKDDPYDLPGFWPFPRPLMWNETNERFHPRGEWQYARDIYDEINLLSTRIQGLEHALRVAGVYDSSVGDAVEAILSPGSNNKLIPVDGFLALREKGGLKGVIEWLPLEQVVAALVSLREQRTENMRLLYEVTGWSDLMRGQAENQYATATAEGAKVRFASVRVQAVSEEFARFASELAGLRGALIAHLFDPVTIIKRSNVSRTYDASLAARAVQLLKDEFPSYRVAVKSEALAQEDFASLQNERVAFVQALASLVRDAGPIFQSLGPKGAQAMGSVVKWLLAGFRGGADIERVLDAAIDAAAQQAANPQQQQDPKALAQLMKSQADIAREKQKVQSEAQRQQIKTAAEVQRQQAQLQFNIEEERQRAAVRQDADRRKAALAIATARAKPQGGSDGRS